MPQVEALIFAEHNKLLTENPLLKTKIKSLEELNSLYVKSDSIKTEEINIYKEKVNSDAQIIKNLKSSRKKLIGGSFVGGIVLFIIGLIL